MLGRVSSLCWTRDAKDGSRLECGLSWDPWLYFTVLNDTHSPRAICLDGYRVPFATRTTEQKGPRNSFHFTAKPFLWRFLKVASRKGEWWCQLQEGRQGPYGEGPPQTHAPRKPPNSEALDAPRSIQDLQPGWGPVWTAQSCRPRGPSPTCNYTRGQ